MTPEEEAQHNRAALSLALVELARRLEESDLTLPPFKWRKDVYHPPAKTIGIVLKFMGEVLDYSSEARGPVSFKKSLPMLYFVLMEVLSQIEAYEEHLAKEAAWVKARQ